MIDDLSQDAGELLEESPIGAEEAVELVEGYDHDDVNSQLQDCYAQAEEVLDGEWYDRVGSGLDAISTFTNALEAYEKDEDVSDRRLGELVAAANMGAAYIGTLKSMANDEMVSDVERRRAPDKEESETDFRQYLDTLSDMQETMVEDVVVPGTIRTLSVAGDVREDLDRENRERFNENMKKTLSTYQVVSDYN